MQGVGGGVAGVPPRGSGHSCRASGQGPTWRHAQMERGLPGLRWDSTLPLPSYGGQALSAVRGCRPRSTGLGERQALRFDSEISV